MTGTRLDLDYVTVRPPAWPGLALFVLSLTLAGFLGLRYVDAKEQAGTVVERRAPVAAPERLEQEVRAAQAVRNQLGLPWAAIISAMESAAGEDVAVLLLQPDVPQRTLRLSAEARNREAMFAYLRRLSEAGGFADVQLVSHQVRTDDPQQPVQFTVQASLKGDS